MNSFVIFKFLFVFQDSLVSVQGLTKIHPAPGENLTWTNPEQRPCTHSYSHEAIPRGQTFPEFLFPFPPVQNLSSKQDFLPWAEMPDVYREHQEHHSFSTQALSAITTHRRFPAQALGETLQCLCNPLGSAYHRTEELKLLFRQVRTPAIFNDFKHGPVEERVHEGDRIQRGKRLREWEK